MKTKPEKERGGERRKKEQSGSFQGLRWSGSLEAIAVVGLILAANYFLQPSDIGFFSVSPHPFWIAVILVSVRFSLAESLTGSLLVSTVYILLTIFFGKTSYTFSSLALFSDFREPLLFMAVTAIIGVNRGRAEKLVRDLKNRLAERDAKLVDVELKNQVATIALRQLDDRIAGQFNTVIDLFDMVSATRNMETHQVKLALLRALKQHLSAEECTLLDMQNGKPVVQIQLGTKDYFPYEMDPLKDPVIAGALETRGLAFLTEFMQKNDFESLKNATLLAGPLLDSEGQVSSLVAIHRMPFIEYNPYSFKLFRTMLNWWGKVLDEKRILDELRSKRVVDEDSGLYTYSYFSGRIEQEFARARQYFIPLSVSLIHIEDFDKVIPAKAEELRSTLARIIIRLVSEFEMVSSYRNDDQFACIFPIMTGKDADEKVRRIIDEIDRFDLHPYSDSGKRLSLLFFTADFNAEMENHLDLLAALEQGIASLSTSGQTGNTYLKALEPFTRKTVEAGQLFHDFLGEFLVDGQVREKQKLEQAKLKLSVWMVNFVLSGGVLRLTPNLTDEADESDKTKNDTGKAIRLYELFKNNIFELLDQLNHSATNILCEKMSVAFRERLEHIFNSDQSGPDLKLTLLVFREVHSGGDEYVGIDMRNSLGMDTDLERIRKDESLYYETSMETRPLRHADRALKESLGEWGEKGDLE